ncbi:hypothetical protein MCOR27_003426 [Pyricularia oryzae]|uniref:Acetyl esterase n=4 Tax=Pyricularia TaxID=48558 RepID=A0ABQ8NME5_PYRGI|nr:acetyl esterase [Pyricularia oryzae 70-15]ELQ38409.1 acetyl esterase [Pyricularia oryzae Y34]KAH8845760.1 hypothetical protein MCOR01_002993 [Pyricularia oryzae]KAI6299349.1 hypothetical protein MCOR33_004681 [Pyricularia grisea]EHA47261.1 acetyl esterase [Pyricularia oryzae 70-15]KAH9432735.1 hypothetical protein MCOR02_007415 [Pyricularia oryzae]
MHPLIFLCLGAISAASPCQARDKPFDNLITFGDSFTDNGRLQYYLLNQANPPPPGVLHPEVNQTASGGLAWGQFASRAVGSRYFDYAVSGAVCSNKITPRYFTGLNRTFPTVLEDELPSFVADATVPGDVLYAGDRTAENTVYALWIGTNDIGQNAFLTDSQVAGKNLSTFTDCVWEVFDGIYAAGGRRFVLLNEAPLDLSPLYAPSGSGGSGDSVFWLNKTSYNETQYSQKMMQYTSTINTVFDYGVPFNLLVQSRWPKAVFSIFDVHGFLTDISNTPDAYFDAPANSTGFYHYCRPQNSSDCVNAAEPDSSFMWYDELHPSERTSLHIADEFLQVLGDKSAYGKTWVS